MSQQTWRKHNGVATQATVTAGIADNPAPAAAANTGRMAVEFFNNSATVTMYVSSQPIYATAVANGRPVVAGGSFSDTSSDSAWYVFAASGTVDCRVTTVNPKPGEV